MAGIQRELISWERIAVWETTASCGTTAINSYENHRKNYRITYTKEERMISTLQTARTRSLEATSHQNLPNVVTVFG
jgi:hypothetical protein